MPLHRWAASFMISSRISLSLATGRFSAGSELGSTAAEQGAAVCCSIDGSYLRRYSATKNEQWYCRIEPLS
uniref:Putative secreted protein n=1 Tax=Anopheles triannulatus TaxID=58253 RepID=A0A2M4B804_9DIPT